MKPHLPIWVGLLHSAAQALVPSAEDDQAERDTALARCEPWTVRVGGQTLRVVYEDALDLRGEWPSEGRS
jgi:hypothetical protein